MDEQRRKSIHKKAEAIFKKADDREKVGGDHFETGWQATLELMLLMMEQQVLENPGQLLPMQTSGDDEWDSYLDVMEKLDLPPDKGKARPESVKVGFRSNKPCLIEVFGGG